MNVKYTTTLPQPSITWLGQEAKKRKVSANKILADLLSQAEYDAKKKEYEEGFKYMSRDPEMVELANMGTGETLRLIQEHENN